MVSCDRRAVFAAVVLKSLNRKLSGHRVAEFIRDFRPLYRLTAFQRLAADVARTAQEPGWSHSE